MNYKGFSGKLRVQKGSVHKLNRLLQKRHMCNLYRFLIENCHSCFYKAFNTINSVKINCFRQTFFKGLLSLKISDKIDFWVIFENYID